VLDQEPRSFGKNLSQNPCGQGKVILEVQTTLLQKGANTLRRTEEEIGASGTGASRCTNQVAVVAGKWGLENGAGHHPSSVEG